MSTRLAQIPPSRSAMDSLSELPSRRKTLSLAPTVPFSTLLAIVAASRSTETLSWPYSDLKSMRSRSSPSIPLQVPLVTARLGSRLSLICRGEFRVSIAGSDLLLIGSEFSWLVKISAYKVGNFALLTSFGSCMGAKLLDRHLLYDRISFFFVICNKGFGK